MTAENQQKILLLSFAMAVWSPHSKSSWTIKIDTYSNTAIVQITKPWSKILLIFNLHGNFLGCLLNSTSRKA